MSRILYISRHAQATAGEFYLRGREFVLFLRSHHEVLVRNFVMDNRIAAAENFPKDHDFFADVTDIDEIEAFNPDLIFCEGPLINGLAWSIPVIWLENYLYKGGSIIAEGINLISLQDSQSHDTRELLEEFFHFVGVYPKDWRTLKLKKNVIDFPRIKGFIVPYDSPYPQVDYYQSISLPRDIRNSKWFNIWDGVDYVVGQDAMPLDVSGPRINSNSSSIAFVGLGISKEEFLEKNSTKISYQTDFPEPIASVSLRGNGYVAVLCSDFITDSVCKLGIFNYQFLHQLIEKMVDDSKKNRQVRSGITSIAPKDSSFLATKFLTNEEKVILINRLIGNGESINIEFKTSCLGSKEAQAEIMNQICGFANSSGGYVLVGVDDEGNITGVDTEVKHAGSTDVYLRRFTDVAKHSFKTYLPGMFVIDLVLVNGKTVLLVEIFVSDSIVYRVAKNKTEAYVRENAITQRIEQDQLELLIRKKMK